MFEFIALILVALFINSLVWFSFSIILKRNDIADVGWGLSFILVSLISFKFQNNVNSLLISILTIIWGLRLSFHIFFRNLKKNEDYRYSQWRKNWKKWFYIRSYLQVFLIQNFLVFIISMPLILSIKYNSPSLNIINYIGLIIWVIGFLFESIGDFQLMQFKNKFSNKGKIMTSGLWSITRHPNYFGEVSLWWGIFFISISSVYNIIGIVGTVTISFLILGVSGIPMLEKKYVGNKDYDDYKRKTSAFFPLPSKIISKNDQYNN